MTKDNMASERFWNIFFTGIFFLILATQYIILRALNISFPEELALFDIAIMVLATQRLTRLFVYDKILRFFRESFSKQGWQGTVKSLLSCPWCVSMWFAPFIIFFYLLSTQFMFLYLVLAIASIAAMMQIVINAIGHWGEKHNR